jgi:hypothetical protein
MPEKRELLSLSQSIDCCDWFVSLCLLSSFPSLWHPISFPSHPNFRFPLDLPWAALFPARPVHGVQKRLERCLPRLSGDLDASEDQIGRHVT